MEIEGAIALVDQLIGENGLTDLQEQILRRVWVKEKYPDIAESLGYDANYIKDLGAKLWKQLSQALDEKVTKSNLQSVLRRHENRYVLPNPGQESAVSSETQFRGERIITSKFVGREPVLKELETCIQTQSSSVIAITGIAGIGKTMVAAKFVEQQHTHFDYVLCQVLKHPKQLPDFLQDLQTQLRISPSTHQTSWQIKDLIETLSQLRCLLIFDGCDSLPSAKDVSDHSLSNDYRLLFQQLNTVKHQSTIILTSRDDISSWLFANNTSLKTIKLNPFSVDEVQQSFATQGDFVGRPTDWDMITEQYGGNPLALQIVSRNVLDFFQGNLSDFLQEGQVVYQGLSAFLEQQWKTLSSQEQWTLYYLAMRREPVSFKEIKSDSLDLSLQRRLSEIVASLVRRSLIHKTGATFSLQAAISEYVTFQLTDTIAIEILHHQLQLISQLPLIKIISRNHRQNEQKQFILQPILDQLHSHLYNSASIQAHLQGQLTQVKGSSPSYLSGNLLNLLIQLDLPLPQLDLTGLPLWEVSLSGISLHQFNLQQCDLARTEFSHAFSGVTSVSICPDEQQFATGHDNGLVFLWSFEGRQIQRFEGHKSWVWDLDWTPDGQQLISVSEDQTLRVWNPTSGDCYQILTGHQDRIWQVVCPSNDLAISSSSDHMIKVWSIQDGSCMSTLSGHQGDITALTLGEAGEIISGSSDQTIRLWNFLTGEEVQSWQHPTGGIWAIAYSHLNSTVYSAGDQGIIACWQREQSTPSQILQYQTHRIWSLSLSACEKYLMAGGEGNQLLRWDLANGYVDRVISDYEGKIWSVQYSHSAQQVFTASEDNKICLWNIDTSQPIFSLRSYSNWACSLVMIPRDTGLSSERIASVHKDGQVCIWDTVNPIPINSFAAHQQPIWSLAINAQGTQLISGSEDKTLRIWDIASGHCQTIIRGHQRQIWSVAWSSDGEFIASGSGDRTVKLWNPKSGDCLATLEGHQSRVWSVAICPNNQHIASGSGDRTIKLWNRQTGECESTLAEHSSQILALAYHPIDPQRLASAGGRGTCIIWELSTFEFETISVQSQMIWSIAWSSDGNLLALGGDNGCIYIWSQTSQSITQQIESEMGCIWAVAFNSDGTQLYSSSQKGTLDIWDIQTGQRQKSLQPKRLYEDLNLIDAHGLTPAQRQNLAKLGAKV